MATGRTYRFISVEKYRRCFDFALSPTLDTCQFFGHSDGVFVSRNGEFICLRPEA